MPGRVSWASIHDGGRVSNHFGRAYSERPKKLPPKWHYSPAWTWSAASKTLLREFSHPVLRSWEDVFFLFPQGKKAVLVCEACDSWSHFCPDTAQRARRPDSSGHRCVWRHWVNHKEIPETFKRNFNLTSPPHLRRSTSTHLSEAKEGLHIYWQKLAFSLMVSWIQGNYGKDWWKSFNSCYGDSMMAARLKMSFINHHRARECDNEWVNYTSIWGWYYPSATLIN